MTPAATPTSAPTTDPVRAALDDPLVRDDLAAHAIARLGIRLADRPAAVRLELARDAVQEAVARAWDRRASFDPAAGVSPAGWLHGFLNNVLSELCRAARKQPAQPLADPAAWDDLTARASPDLRVLTELLDRLPSDQRQIITLHHLDGLTHQQIGERFGVSDGASRARLARAMLDLKRLAAGEVSR